MPATTITASTVTRAGVALTGSPATATQGDKFLNTGNEIVIVKNGSSSPITVTLKFGVNGKVDGQSATERTVTVDNATSKVIGAFPKGAYNDASGYFTVVCSDATDVTVQVLKVVPAT